MRRVLIEEPIWHHHVAEPETTIEGSLHRKKLRNLRTEPADRTLLDRHQRFVLSRDSADQILVERLSETRIGDRC